MALDTLAQKPRKSSSRPAARLIFGVNVPMTSRMKSAKKYTSTLDIADREAGGIATADAQHRRMIEHLARRGQAMLRACGKDQPPVYAALGIIKPPAKGGSA